MIPIGYLVVPSGYHRKKTQQWAFRFQKALGAFMHYKVASKYKGKIMSGLHFLKKKALTVCGGQIQLDDVSSRYTKNNSARLKHP